MDTIFNHAYSKDSYVTVQLNVLHTQHNYARN